MNLPEYARILQKCFDAARAGRDSLSLRSFSQQIGLDHSTVSRILQGRRQLSIGQGVKILANLGLVEEDKRQFIESLLKEQIQAKLASFSNKITSSVDGVDEVDTSLILRQIAEEVTEEHR